MFSHKCIRIPLTEAKKSRKSKPQLLLAPLISSFNKASIENKIVPRQEPNANDKT